MSLKASIARRPSPSASVNEMSVRFGRGRRHVLHDHVEVDLGAGDGLEDRRGLADLVGHTDNGDLCLAAVVRDTGDDRLLHVGLVTSFGLVG